MSMAPDVIQKLLELEQLHAPLKVTQWGFEELLLHFWRLSRDALCSLYGSVPALGGKPCGSDFIELMRAEARNFRDTCRSAERHQFWTSTDARHLAELIRNRYSNDPKRFIVCKSPEAQHAVVEFYLDCAGLLDLISLHEQIERQGKRTVSLPIGPGTYEGIAQRVEKLLTILDKP